MRLIGLSDTKCETFLKDLRLARSVAIICDYDGTLAPFKKERNLAVPYDGIRELIDKILLHSSLRFVIVSGRPVSEVLELLGTSSQPEIWGAHGWEHLKPNGAFRSWRVNEKALCGFSRAMQAVESKSLIQYCEIKTASLALHWRGITDESKKEMEDLVDSDFKSIAFDYDLKIRPFNGGVELLSNERNKGCAIDEIIGSGPADNYPVYLGDDFTDEYAFEAVTRAEGNGILVSDKSRPSKAQFQLIPPDGVIDFLQFCITMKEG